MKKSILLFVLIFLSLPLFSQDEPDVSLKNSELKLNALFLVIGALEVEYEYILNDESAVGVSAFLPIDEDVDINYYISPYYRWYFGKKRAAGFFVEGFGMLNSVENENFMFDDLTFESSSTFETKTDFAIGVGLGAKFITTRNFIAEIYGGVGRNLFNTDGDDDFEIVAKGGIKIGLRF